MKKVMKKRKRLVLITIAGSLLLGTMLFAASTNAASDMQMNKNVTMNVHDNGNGTITIDITKKITMSKEFFKKWMQMRHHHMDYATPAKADTTTTSSDTSTSNQSNTSPSNTTPAS